MITVTVADVWLLAVELKREYPDWRWGQSAFNALRRLKPGVADQVHGNALDPFYNDSVLPEFWQFVSGRLGKG